MQKCEPDLRLVCLVSSLIRPFASDTSPKRIDREGQGKRRTGTRQDSNNYRPLDKPMVETTTKKAQQLIKTLLSEGTLIKRRLNGSPLRLILRESQCFTHLLKSTNRHLSEDLLSQGVPDLQNGSQRFLTTSFSE